MNNIIVPVVPEDQKTIKLSFSASWTPTGSFESSSRTSYRSSNRFWHPVAAPKQSTFISLFDEYFDFCDPPITLSAYSGVHIISLATFRSSSWERCMYFHQISSRVFVFYLLKVWYEYVLDVTCPAIVSSSKAISPVLENAPKCQAANIDRYE